MPKTKAGVSIRVKFDIQAILIQHNSNGIAGQNRKESVKKSER
ncbi:MAG: hypothetical protein PHU08_01750 [Dehalococcoidales bacterium]|nr:hypothetical protein [Dehalococcoidales bacterium]